MVTAIVWTLVALVVAGLVLAVASVAESRSGERAGGVRGYVADVRAGLRTWRASRSKDADARPAPQAEPVDTSIDDFLAATQVQDPAYVAVEDLTDTLARARERAARGVSGLTRR
jgi:hypothetical protein